MLNDLAHYKEAIISQNLAHAKSISIAGSDPKAIAFILGCLQILHPSLTKTEIEKSVIDGTDDATIDAIAIIKENIYIYDFKRSKGFQRSDIIDYRDHLENYIFDIGDLTSLNGRAQLNIKEARDLISTGRYKTFLRVVRGGEYIDNTHKQHLESIEYSNTTKQFLSLCQIVETECKTNELPNGFHWRIEFKENTPGSSVNKSLYIPSNTDPHSLICRLSLKQFVDLYYKFSPNSEKIFESNVRGLLSTGKVHKNILLSLGSTNKAKEFYKLHNGITITCDGIKSINRSKCDLLNPQIVNGCQTISIISKAFKAKRNSSILDYGSVLVKIFKVKSNEVEKICQASNTQNSINFWDLRSNDLIQIIIQNYLCKKGIRYNRKIYKVNKSNWFKLSDLGQWLCSALLRKPAYAKNSKSKIFDLYDKDNTYKKLFSSGTKLNEVLVIVRIAMNLKAKLKIEKTKNSYHNQANFHFLAGIYYLFKKKNYSNFDSAYSKVDIRIKRFNKNEKISEPRLYASTYTKSDEPWKFIEKSLKKLKEQ